MLYLKPEIKIGFLTVHLYGLIIAVAIYAGYQVAKKRASIYNLSQKIFDDPILLVPLVLAIVGARVYHVADYWSIYSRHPIEILYIANGGLGIWGAIAGAILGFWFVAKVRNLNFLLALDLASPSLLLGQVIGRLGNYVNQEGFGPPTNLPWSVYIRPENRPHQYGQFSNFHPTFFYEAILDFIFFLILIALAKKLKKGQAFALYLIFYSTTRFTSEFWRIDTWIVEGVKIAHIISIASLIIGLVLFTKHALDTT